MPDKTPSTLRLRDGDQPLPTPGRASVQDRLIEEIARRRTLGIARYGRQLETHNGRDALRDAYEEVLDLATYLTQVVMERADQAAAVRELDAWIVEHPDEPGGARIAKARELLAGGRL